MRLLLQDDGEPVHRVGALGVSDKLAAHTAVDIAPVERSIWVFGCRAPPLPAPSGQRFVSLARSDRQAAYIRTSQRKATVL